MILFINFNDTYSYKGFSLYSIFIILSKFISLHFIFFKFAENTTFIFIWKLQSFCGKWFSNCRVFPNSGHTILKAKYFYLLFIIFTIIFSNIFRINLKYHLIYKILILLLVPHCMIQILFIISLKHIINLIHHLQDIF